MEQFNEVEAKSFAMSDIGLTSDEADEAISDFVSRLDDSERYCNDCYVKLTKYNCYNELNDDYCNECHNKLQFNLVKRMGGIHACGFDDVNDLHRHCEGSA